MNELERKQQLLDFLRERLGSHFGVARLAQTKAITARCISFF